MTQQINHDQPQIGINRAPWLQLVKAYEVYLKRVRRYRSKWPSPHCYLSHMPNQIEWAKKLSNHLHHAGIHVVENAELVQPNDFVVVLDAPDYRQAYYDLSPALLADISVVQSRFEKKNRLIALALQGGREVHKFENCDLGVFCDETHYLVGLFDLVLNLYSIPLTHASFIPMRQALHKQWEHTAYGTKGNSLVIPLKVFISYSHKDEEFKNELVTMLATLQRWGLVDAWQDRHIEAGDEWNQAIQTAMDDCDLALLLISPDYLASRFIQEAEQPKLLQRRAEMQTRVIPIIVRPCMWQSEPALKGIQALPRDNKAVITFSKETGARDQAWADIAAVIEERAKARSTT